MKKLLSLFLAAIFGIVLSVAPCNAGTYSGGNPLVPTYSATTPFLTPYATPQDIVVIGGSGTKTIKVHSITLSSTQTTAGVNSWYLNKLSTADSGGTSTALTKIPNDSAYAAATATALYYTAAPTPGTIIGAVSSSSVGTNSPATVGAIAEVDLFTDQYNGQPIVLRGAAQQLALNFNGAAVPTGLSISVNIIWTEE